MDIGAGADDVETVEGDSSGLGMVGRIPAHKDLRVVHGMLVLGM